MKKIFTLFNVFLFFSLNAADYLPGNTSKCLFIQGAYVFSKYNNTFILGTSYKTGNKLKFDLEFEYDNKHFLTNETTSDLRYYNFSAGINYRIVNNRKFLLPIDILINFHYAYSNFQDRYNTYINEAISENAFIYGLSIKKDFTLGENYGFTPQLKINHFLSNVNNNSILNANHAILFAPQINIKYDFVYCYLRYAHSINILGNSGGIYQAYNDGIHLGVGIVI